MSFGCGSPAPRVAAAGHAPRPSPLRLALSAAGMLAAGPLPAQQPMPARPFLLDVPATVRSAALNGAAAALVGDAGAVFANPAGLATISHVSLDASFRTAPADAFVASGALASRLRQFDLGFGFRVLDFGPRPGVYLGPAVLQGTEAREFMGVGALVYRFGMIAVGATGKFLRRRVGSDRQRAISADAGLAIAIFDIAALGFSVQNIGDNWDGDSPLDLPRLTRFGFTMNYVDPQESFRLLSTLEVQWPEGESARFVLGGEAGVVLGDVAGLIGRIGWGSRPTDVAQSQGTFGATLSFSRVNFDYAFKQSDLLGESAHRLGLRLTL